METILNNKLRVGNFTSSEIHKLMVGGTSPMTADEIAQQKIDNPKSTRKTKDVMFGAGALTYIKEKVYERRLKCSLATESNAKPLTWGKFMESRCFELLGNEYILNSQETDLHPTINTWSGSRDGNKSDGKTLIEIKCPYTRKSFCELVELETAEDIKEHSPEYYWQMVSNACIMGVDKAELIIYMPYLSELESIKYDCGQIDSPSQKNFAWINFAEVEELPHLIDGEYYKSVNIKAFNIPEADKLELTYRVLAASQKLTA